MALHPQSEAYLKWLAKEEVPPLSALSPLEARVWDAKVVGLLTKEAPWTGVIENQHVPGPAGEIAVRIYTPDHPQVSCLLLYFHGGGWVLGNLDQVEQSCRLLATSTGRIVVSVDYRLAPENKFPSSLEDCFAVAKWTAENSDKLGASKEKMAVCGDSAGGNLAAAVCLMAKDQRGPTITNQVLIYPITDLSNQNYQDYHDNLSPALTKSDMNWFIKHYISSNADSRNQYASPVFRPDLTGLPSALFITAEYDILTKQCNTYANLLKNAGVRVNLAYYPGLVHGFFTLPDIFDGARNAVSRIAEELSSN